MRTFLQVLTTPEEWPSWLAFGAVALMGHLLVLMAFNAWDANFPA